MDEAPDLKRHLPHALIATFLVVVVPLVVMTRIEAAGLPSPFLSVGLGMLISVLAATAGAAFWARQPASKDVVFADLMVWGWLRRSRTERRLAHAAGLLGLGRERSDEPAELSPELQAKALEELSSALEASDPYTHGHTRRVTRHSQMIATQMSLPPAYVAKVRSAAAVHDVGKISIPKDVLNKPGKLTDEEFALIKRHAEDGAVLASRIGDPEITEMVRHHHERQDGSGYPNRLSEEAIPLGARIIAVADTFDAITSSRPYRPACPHKTAIEILRQEAGAQLDADAVAAFLRYYAGRRAVGWWTLATAAFQRIAALLGRAFGGAPITQAAATVGAAAVLGASVVAPVLRTVTGTDSGGDYPTASYERRLPAPDFRSQPDSSVRTGSGSERPKKPAFSPDRPGLPSDGGLVMPPGSALPLPNADIPASQDPSSGTGSKPSEQQPSESTSPRKDRKDPPRNDPAPAPAEPGGPTSQPEPGGNAGGTVPGSDTTPGPDRGPGKRVGNGNGGQGASPPGKGVAR